MADKSVCKINDCGKAVLYKGLCGGHYRKLNRYGDPLAGGTQNGKPLAFAEMAAQHNEDGDCLIWPFTRCSHGYGQLWIDGKRVKAHRYICNLAHGNPPKEKPDVAHSCGKGHLGCVNPRHLRWASHAENMREKEAHGTVAKGTKNGHAKLTDEAAAYIFIAKGHITQRELADSFGVTQATISDIWCKRTWRHIHGLDGGIA